MLKKLVLRYYNMNDVAHIIIRDIEIVHFVQFKALMFSI